MTKAEQEWLGREDEAREVLKLLLTRSVEHHVPPFYIAIVYAQLGEVDPAFEWLGRRGLATGGGRRLVDIQDPLRSSSVCTDTSAFLHAFSMV